MSGPSARDLVWIDGALVPVAHARIGVFDRGFTLGDGLFETMFWDGRNIRFLSDHLARLQASARALSFPIPLSLDDIAIGLRALAEPSIGKTAAIRITLSRGIGPRGLSLPKQSQAAMMASITDYVPPTTSVCLHTVSIARNPTAPSSRYKTLSYIDNVMALQEAQTLGGDDGLMLGTNGHVACASSANIILEFDGACITPPLRDGAMAGIVRGRLVEAKLVKERSITAEMLHQCTSAALTNALIGVRAVSQVNGRALGPSDRIAQMARFIQV